MATRPQHDRSADAPTRDVSRAPAIPESPRPARRDVLRLGAAGMLGAAGVLGAGAATGGSSAHAAGTVDRLGPITGPGLTTAFGMEATDLGIPVRCPDGRVLYVFGDTWERAGVPFDQAGAWRSPTGLYTDGSHPSGGISFTGAVGGSFATQLLPYEHHVNGIGTKIPSDVIEVDGVLYLYVWLNAAEDPFGTSRGTEVWSSGDNGATWQFRTSFGADAWGGIMQNISWTRHSDGFVYMYCSKYRDGSLHMFRIPADRLGDANAYEPWGWNEANGWAWGQAPTPILRGRFGEMSLRELDGRFVLTWFDVDAYQIRGFVVDQPWSDLTVAPAQTLLRGGAWGAESNDVVAQLYGSYIVPGSTLDDLHLVVSQWHTESWGNDPYHAMHFRIRGAF